MTENNKKKGKKRGSYKTESSKKLKAITKQIVNHFNKYFY